METVRTLVILIQGLDEFLWVNHVGDSTFDFARSPVTWCLLLLMSDNRTQLSAPLLRPARVVDLLASPLGI